MKFRPGAAGYTVALQRGIVLASAPSGLPETMYRQVAGDTDELFYELWADSHTGSRQPWTAGIRTDAPRAYLFPARK